MFKMEYDLKIQLDRIEQKIDLLMGSEEEENEEEGEEREEYEQN